MKTKLSLLLFIALQLMTGKNTMAQTDNILTVKIVGIKEVKGKLHVYLYSQNKGFPLKSEKADRQIEVIVNANKISVQFTQIPKGTYAVSVYQDVDSDGEMGTNFLGIPKEPIAVSNNAKGSFGPPKFDDAKFNFDKSMAIEIRLE